jgi:hypothetical protein
MFMGHAYRDKEVVGVFVFVRRYVAGGNLFFALPW